MTDRCETFRICRNTIPLSSLKVSNLYTVAFGFYGSSNEQNRMCELCTFSQIQSHIEVKFCSYNLLSNFNFYLWNGVLLFQQPLHNHHARLLQLSKAMNTLQKLPQPYHNLTNLKQGSVW